MQTFNHSKIQQALGTRSCVLQTFTFTNLNLRTFYITEINSDKNLELGKLQPPRPGQQELAE